MPDKCENQTPTFRVSMHVPKTPWHKHEDWVFTNKAPTEWGALAKTLRDMVTKLSGGNLRLTVGYLADVLNVLPSNVRAALIGAVAQGLGLEIKGVEGEKDTVEVGLVPRYPPLVANKPAPGGIVVPETGPGGLVLPGQRGFNQKG